MGPVRVWMTDHASLQKHAQFGDVFEGMLPEVLDQDCLFRDGDHRRSTSRPVEATAQERIVDLKGRFCGRLSTAQRCP